MHCLRISASDMPKPNLHIIPTAFTLLLLATFIITYIISVHENHVGIIFPYVSSTGSKEPESYLFSFLLNITVYLLAACVYARHLFVTKFARFRKPKGFFLNKVATFMGLVSCIGLHLVANFQVTKCQPVHCSGAFLCFAGGTTYFALQIILATHTVEAFETKILFIIRMVLTLCSFLLLVLAITTGLIAKHKFLGINQSLWSYGEGGYMFHVVSTFSEWLLIITQGGLVLTFLPTFRCVAIKQPKFSIEGICSPSLVYDEIDYAPFDVAVIFG